jgi:hypothetical protein
MKQTWYRLIRNCLLVLFGLWTVSRTIEPARATALAGPPGWAGDAQPLAVGWSPYINAWPSSDGLGLYVSIGQPTQTITTVTALVDVPGSGPTGYKESHTLQYVGVREGLETFAYLFNGAFSSTTGTFAGTVTVSATGGITAPLQVGPLNFIRYPIPVDHAVDLSSADGLLKLHLDANSLANAAYGLVVPANTPPGQLPFNHAAASSIYNIRASGAVITTSQPGVLWLYYTPETLGGLDPDTLHIFRWNGAAMRWVDLGGTHLVVNKAILTTVDQFGVYALLALKGPIYSAYLPLIHR